MKTLEDMFNQELKAGDVILYSVKHSTYVKTHLAVITAVVDKGRDDYRKGRYSLRVTTFDQDVWHWNKELKQSEWKDRVYKTTLISNSSIVRLNGFKFPDSFKELLHLSYNG